MRTLTLFALTLTAGGGMTPAQDEPKKQEWQPPAVKAGENGWEDYVDAPVYGEKEAKELAPAGDSPEAILVFFYASKLRGDEEWKKALPPKDKWPKKLERKLQKMEKWKFVKFQLVGRKKKSDDVYWIKIYMEVEIEGKKDSGKDEAELQRIDGKWYVALPPT